MIQDPSYQYLRELSWRRKLTPAEEAELRAWLLAHPEAEAEWETEAALNEALSELPNAPVATNFTSRVLETVRVEEAAAARLHEQSQRGWSWLRGWFPKTAVASTVLVLALGLYHHGLVVKRKEMARSVLAIASVPTLPKPDVLENFTAVRSLNRTPPDEDLLALFPQ